MTMRINLARKTQKGLMDRFLKEMIRDFAEEFDFPNQATTLSYVTTGKQGLIAFVGFVNDRGYKAEIYHLDPNKELFTDVGDSWQSVSRNSPSYGFTIPENDPKLVEFKLKHL
jgi:hypothetical protein